MSFSTIIKNLFFGKTLFYTSSSGVSMAFSKCLSGTTVSIGFEINKPYIVPVSRLTLISQLVYSLFQDSKCELITIPSRLLVQDKNLAIRDTSSNTNMALTVQGSSVHLGATIESKQKIVCKDRYLLVTARIKSNILKERSLLASCNQMERIFDALIEQMKFHLYNPVTDIQTLLMTKKKASVCKISYS
jgi:hypothetical protein